MTVFFDDNAVSDHFQLLANKLNHRLLAALRDNGPAADTAAKAGRQAFAAITAFTRRVRAATELHHVIPKFLGGLTGQKSILLQRISAAAHDDFHKLLKNKLVERGFDPNMMKGGRAGSRRAWLRLFADKRGSQGKAFRAVLDASREIDKVHGTTLADQVLSLLRGRCFAGPK